MAKQHSIVKTVGCLCQGGATDSHLELKARAIGLLK